MSNGSNDQATSYYGEVRRDNDQPVLHFERHFAHPIEKIWRALTEPEELRGWFPARIEGEWKAGATLRFVFPDEEEAPSQGTVLEIEPLRLLAYIWEQEQLRWELEPTASGCKLTFTSTLDPAYPLLGTITGWHVCLDLLHAQLAGIRPPWTVSKHTEQLRAEYAARIEAA
jgi:uncharacterized protein YndB with AHSA1/START domain